MFYDVIIIGKGPAGLSASLYTARGNLRTLVIGQESRLVKAKQIENFCCGGVASGEELLARGVSQAERFGVRMIDEEVVDLKRRDDHFVVVADKMTYEGKAIIIATGKNNVPVPVADLEKYLGKGVHYCVLCDGFFYQEAKVGVLGFKDFAVHELRELEGITNKLTLYTNGNSLQVSKENEQYLMDKQIPVKTDPIRAVAGGDFLTQLLFQDGSAEELEGLFVAYGSASSVDFARKLGVRIENGSIVVDQNQKTNVSGVFAAGDCTGGLAQVSVAVGQGAVAGEQAKRYVKALQDG